MELAFTIFRRSCALAALATALLGCPGPQGAMIGAQGGPCEGYPCTAEGARAMLRSTLEGSGRDIRGAEPQADRMLSNAARKMGERGYTPYSFRLAAQNMKKLLDASPHGAEDTTGRELERVNRSTHWLCPLWPLC